jgi:hypothetical protein
MYKHIFAAVIALNETKTLHVVEEFHGAVCPFASRFALWAAWCRITVTATKSTAIITAWRTVTIKSGTLRTVGTRCPICHCHRFAVDHEISCRHLSAALHKLELERLAFGKTSQSSLFDGADVHEDVVGTSVYLNEAKTFLAIEKFDNSFAGTNDLSWHWGSARATTRGTKATSATATAAPAIAAAIATAATAAA